MKILLILLVSTFAVSVPSYAGKFFEEPKVIKEQKVKRDDRKIQKEEARTGEDSTSS